MLPTNPLLNATTPAGPHLPVGLLRQYAAGTLAPAAQHRVEAHTLACSRCADILAGLQQTPPATTDQALAQLQQRLRQRVQQQAAPARYDHEAQRNRWLIPQLAAAAALLLGLVAGGWWAWQQRRTERATLAVAVAPAAAPAAPAAPPERSVAVADPLPSTGARRYKYAPSPARPPRDQAASSDARLVRRLPAQPAAGAPRLALPPVADSAELAPVAPAATASALVQKPGPADSLALAYRATSQALVAARRATAEEAAPLRAASMPAVPKLPPAPAGGYSALREKLRREAAEFRPEAPEQPLSGTVQLRLTIGADGKIQQTKVLRGLREDYDAEAQRLVCDGPGWIPGISGGRRAALEVDIAVPF